jgi:RNA polymerase sigma factor (sigma-70 family)
MKLPSQHQPALTSCPSDENLLAEVQKDHNPKAAAQLVERYLPRVYGYIRPLACCAHLHAEEIEDALQEGILTLLRVIHSDHLEGLQSSDGRAFAAYVKRCVRNHCLNDCRSRRRRKRRVGLFTDLGLAAADDLPTAAGVGSSNQEGPAECAEWQERVERLGAALEELSLEEYGLLAWVMAKVSLQRIAKCRGVSLATVKRAWKQLRAKLRARLDRACA